MRRQLKKSSDYPQFFFRLRNAQEKKQIEKLLGQALASANARLKDDQKEYGKGEILRVALLEGLEMVRKKKVKLPD